jgi:hypothetical protein
LPSVTVSVTPVPIEWGSKMLTERDTVLPSGKFNWRAIKEIATLRALAERDIEIIELVYGAPLRKPADVGFHNINDWRAKLAEKALIANPQLETTPYIQLYRHEMRRACAAARAVRNGMNLRGRVVSAKVVSLSTLRLVDQLIASVREPA